MTSPICSRRPMMTTPEMEEVVARLENDLAYFDALNEKAEAAGLSRYTKGSFGGEAVRALLSERRKMVEALRRIRIQSEDCLGVRAENITNICDAILTGSETPTEKTNA